MQMQTKHGNLIALDPAHADTNYDKFKITTETLGSGSKTREMQDKFLNYPGENGSGKRIAIDKLGRNTSNMSVKSSEKSISRRKLSQSMGKAGEFTHDDSGHSMKSGRSAHSNISKRSTRKRFIHNKT